MQQLPPGSVNRRAAIRRKPKGVQAACRRSGLILGPDIALVLRSLSETGALLLVTGPLVQGDGVEIELTSLAYPKPIRLPAKVVRVKAVPGNVYCVAVRFQDRLSYAQFTRLT